MRFTEDLVQIARLMGCEINRTADLVLVDTNGQVISMKSVEMTEANLRRLVAQDRIIPRAVQRQQQPDWARVSPFTEVQLEGESTKVRFQGKMYGLVSIDGLTTQRLFEASRQKFVDRWQERFVEDLVEVMEAAGNARRKP